MADHRYEASRTALLLVDPYNDFLSEGGKLWDTLRPVATEVGLLDNLRAATAAAQRRRRGDVRRAAPQVGAG
jgi:nicotinamidase-related amidase